MKTKTLPSFLLTVSLLLFSWQAAVFGQTPTPTGTLHHTVHHHKAPDSAATPSQPGIPPQPFTYDNATVGQCEMKDISLYLRPDGTAHFESTVRTKRTLMFDEFHLEFHLRDSNGAVLYSAHLDGPQMRGPFGSDWMTFQNDFTFPADLYNKIQSVNFDCGC